MSRESLRRSHTKGSWKLSPVSSAKIRTTHLIQCVVLRFIHWYQRVSAIRIKNCFQAMTNALCFTQRSNIIVEEVYKNRCTFKSTCAFLKQQVHCIKCVVCFHDTKRDPNGSLFCITDAELLTTPNDSELFLFAPTFVFFAFWSAHVFTSIFIVTKKKQTLFRMSACEAALFEVSTFVLPLHHSGLFFIPENQ